MFTFRNIVNKIFVYMLQKLQKNHKPVTKLSNKYLKNCHQDKICPMGRGGEREGGGDI